MDRLTVYLDDGEYKYGLAACAKCTDWGVYCMDCIKFSEAVCKLAAYENEAEQREQGSISAKV